MTEQKPKELFEVHVPATQGWKTIGSFATSQDAFGYVKQMKLNDRSHRVVREIYNPATGQFTRRKILAEKVVQAKELGGGAAAKARENERKVEERAARMKNGGVAPLSSLDEPPEERSVFEMFVETLKQERASGSGRSAGKGFGKE